MVQLVNRAEVLGLLDEVGELADQLTPNEREMVSTIKAKYDGLGDESFDDKICIEVIIRNVGIREGFGMKPSEAAMRSIDLPTEGGDE